MNNVAMNTCTQVTLGTYACIFLEYMTRFISEKALPNSFPGRLCLFIFLAFPSTAKENSMALHFRQHLVLSVFFFFFLILAVWMMQSAN